MNSIQLVETMTLHAGILVAIDVGVFVSSGRKTDFLIFLEVVE